MDGSARPDTFAHQWAHSVAARAAETFLIFEGPDGHVAEWTYGDFDRVVSRTASLLCDHGVGEGSCVHLALTNSPTFVAVWLAANRMGAWIQGMKALIPRSWMTALSSQSRAGPWSQPAPLPNPEQLPRWCRNPQLSPSVRRCRAH